MSALTDSIQKVRDSISKLGKRGGSAEGGGSEGAGGKFDPKAALAWIKTHPLIVAAVAVMVLAPVTAWWFASDIHSANDEAANKRAQEMASLEKLEKEAHRIASVMYEKAGPGAGAPGAEAGAPPPAEKGGKDGVIDAEFEESN